MTNKVPVFRSVAAGYGFLFKQFPEIIRITWFPILAISLLNWYQIQSFMDVFEPITSGEDTAIDVSEFSAPFGQLGLMYVASFIGMAVIFMGLVRIYFDLPRGQSLIYFRFGLPEIRFLIFTLLWLLGFIFLYLFFFGIPILLTIFLGGGLENSPEPIAAITPLAQSSPEPRGWMLAVVVVFFLAGFISFNLYVIRFSIAPAVIAAEKRVGFIRTWRLTKSNFWRLFFGFFLSILPLILIQIVVFRYFFLPAMMPGSEPIEGNVPFDPAEIDAIFGWFFSFPAIAVSSLVSVLIYAIFIGFLSRAYEGLVDA